MWLGCVRARLCVSARLLSFDYCSLTIKWIFDIIVAPNSLKKSQKNVILTKSKNPQKENKNEAFKKLFAIRGRDYFFLPFFLTDGKWVAFVYVEFATKKNAQMF